MPYLESELILTDNERIYHLDLAPGEVAKKIILVGDQERVPKVSKFFDTIEVKRSKREFVTHTGTYQGERITCISTGIGTDNIDIVLNELDALVNIDFNSRTVKKTHTSLDIIRIGTSGTIQNNIPLDSFLISEKAIGFDSLMHFYKSDHVLEKTISDAFVKQTNWGAEKSTPYVVTYDATLGSKFKSDKIISGFTATNVGFYGPQSRVLRLNISDESLNDKLANFSFEGSNITNLEMETAGIYGMAKLLGHKAVSLNAILANRATGQFSENPKALVEDLITFTLEKIVS